MLVTFSLRFTRKIQNKNRWIISFLTVTESVKLPENIGRITPKIRAETLTHAKKKLNNNKWVCKDIATNFE